MSESLNEILGEIEEDLKKLQSAREQVLSVIESNQSYTSAANELVKNTQSLISEVSVTTEKAVNQFSKKLTESKASIDKVVTDGVFQIENSAKKIKEINQKLVETVKTELNEIALSASDSVEKVTALSLKTIRDSSAQIKTTLEQQKVNNQKVLDETATQSIQIIKTSSDQAEATLNELKNENLKTINHILETHNQIKLLIAQLLDYDLPNSLKTVKSKVELIEMEQKKQFDVTRKNQMWMFVGLGVIFAAIILFQVIKV